MVDTKEILTRVAVFLVSFASVLALFSGVLFIVKKFVAAKIHSEELE